DFTEESENVLDCLFRRKIRPQAETAVSIMTSAGGASSKPKKLDEMFVNDLLGLRSKLAAAFSQELCLNSHLTVSVANDAVCRRLIERSPNLPEHLGREFGFSMKIRNWSAAQEVL